MSRIRHPWVAPCSEVAEHLSDVVDGTLPRRVRGRVHRHLARCAGCQQVLAAVRRVIAGLRAPADIDPSTTHAPSVAESVLARIQTESDRQESP